MPTLLERAALPPRGRLAGAAGPRVRGSWSGALLVLSLLALAGAVGVFAFWFQGDGKRAAHRSAPPSAQPSAGGLKLPALPDGDAGAAEPDPLEENQVRVFFTADGIRLRAQVMDLPRAMSDHERLRFALDELLRGPATGKLRPAIPAGTRLRAMFLHNNEALLDFSSELASQPLGGLRAELLCAYAIVQTVVENVKSVAVVRILIEGQTPLALWGEVDLASGLTGDSSRVER
jgi:hypothetical protein